MSKHHFFYCFRRFEILILHNNRLISTETFDACFSYLVAFFLMNLSSYCSVTTTTSGVLPVRMAGPHVPVPFVVYKV